MKATGAGQITAVRRSPTEELPHSLGSGGGGSALTRGSTVSAAGESRICSLEVSAQHWRWRAPGQGEGRRLRDAPPQPQHTCLLPSQTSVLHMCSLFHAFIFAQLWTVYCEQSAVATNVQNQNEFSFTAILTALEFWSRVTPSILQLMAHNKVVSSLGSELSPLPPRVSAAPGVRGHARIRILLPVMVAAPLPKSL